MKNICSRGYGLSQLSDMLLPSTDTTGGEIATTYIEESEFKYSDAIFDTLSNRILISDLVGNLHLNKGNGFLSKLGLVIWLPSDDNVNGIEDTVINDNEIIKKFELTATDSGVTDNK